MYCPRCGNQPVVDRMRFCPSCGFRLDGVVELLARDGAPAGQPQVMPPAPEAPSPRKRGIRRGAKVLFTSIGLLFPALAFAIGVTNDPGPLVLPLTLFLIGALMMLYSRLFEEDHPAASEVPRMPPPQPVYLQPPQTPVYRPPVEPAPPQSVGEHTTRSLGQ
ncbi:MAG: zinc ribbon domain-containing protein [Blastocatellia bacterium]|nr:zinc ribbon domain-containing protein [Blastocatellia bacterium]